LKEYNDHCVIKDCVFDNNTVLEGDGGVIMVKEKCNHFYLSRSIFSNNEAVGGNGGAVVLQSDCLDMTIDSTIFTNNFAGVNGLCTQHPMIYTFIHHISKRIGPMREVRCI
jgi:hypothetical protein